MDTNAQIFFLISSVGFVTLWIMLAVCLYYILRAAKSFSRILDKLERDINTIGDTTLELIDEIRDSTIFNFLFKHKKKTSNKTRSK